MSVIADRVFTVTVKMEAPTLAALDEATTLLASRLDAAVPGRLSGLRVIAKWVERRQFSMP